MSRKRRRSPILLRRYIPESPAPVSLGAAPRILVVKLASLGDMLLTTPALRALAHRYPDAQIDVLATEQSADLIRRSPYVRSVYTLDKYAFDYPRQFVSHPWRLIPVIRLLAAMRRGHYDAIILAHHLTLLFGRLKYRALAGLIGARLTVGLDNGHGAYMDLRVPDHGFGAAHEAEYALRLAAVLDAPLNEEQRSLCASDLGWYMPAPPVSETVRVALHPGSGVYSVARRWPADRFAALARYLHRQVQAEIIVLAGAGEDDICQQILEQSAHPEWMTCQKAETTEALARALSTCHLLVANDSFPMHLAVALNVPVVAIFGPSNHEAWGPWTGQPGMATVVRRDDLACSPCIYRGHALGTPQGCPPRPCLTGLSQRLVERAALSALERRTERASQVE